MNSKPKRVLDVGQCGYDHGRISTLLKTLGCEVLQASSEREALSILKSEPIDLVLVNRVFDADGADGVRFIRSLLSGEQANLNIMLVSNYPEYQRMAVSYGARMGFGKESLTSAETKSLLQQVLESQ